VAEAKITQIIKLKHILELVPSLKVTWAFLENTVRLQIIENTVHNLQRIHILTKLFML